MGLREVLLQMHARQYSTALGRTLCTKHADSAARLEGARRHKLPFVVFRTEMFWEKIFLSILQFCCIQFT